MLTELLIYIYMYVCMYVCMYMCVCFMVIYIIAQHSEEWLRSLITRNKNKRETFL